MQTKEDVFKILRIRHQSNHLHYHAIPGRQKDKSRGDCRKFRFATCFYSQTARDFDQSKHRSFPNRSERWVLHRAGKIEGNQTRGNRCGH